MRVDRPGPSPADVLQALRSGRRDAIDELVVVLYDELREIAHRHRVARGGATLNTTALVHEAYVKLAAHSRARWTDRAHFLALAAVAMRHILTDRARARMAAKRGDGRRRITLNEEVFADEEQAGALLELDDALNRLGEVDARLAHVVECRFFGGLTHEEIAAALDLTVRTVERDWAKARMLLRQLMAA